jgi:hypothetical protein
MSGSTLLASGRFNSSRPTGYLLNPGHFDARHEPLLDVDVLVGTASRRDNRTGVAFLTVFWI